MTQWLIDILKGAMIGIANVIPGLSGGTVAVSLGLYDRLIYALTDLFRHFKKSMRTLLPVLAGIAVGIAGFTYAVEFLLRRFALPTCMAFMGLVFGGVPVLWRRFRASLSSGGGRGVSGVFFVAMFALSAALPFLGGASGERGIPLPVWFLIGLIASATMVIPGVSGSMVLVVMGYYYQVIGQLKEFLDAVRNLDLSAAAGLAAPLFFFGIGVLLGIFLIAKCIRFLFERYPAPTYGAILGLVAAAPIPMLVSTGALADLALSSGIGRLALGAVLLAAFFAAVYCTDQKAGGNELKNN